MLSSFIFLWTACLQTGDESVSDYIYVGSSSRITAHRSGEEKLHVCWRLKRRRLEHDHNTKPWLAGSMSVGQVQRRGKR